MRPAHPLFKWFDTGHYKVESAKIVGQNFRTLAERLDRNLPDGAEKTVAMRKLLESKDAAIRALIESEL